MLAKHSRMPQETLLKGDYNYLGFVPTNMYRFQKLGQEILQQFKDLSINKYIFIIVFLIKMFRN